MIWKKKNLDIVHIKYTQMININTSKKKKRRSIIKNFFFFDNSKKIHICAIKWLEID